MTKKEIQETFLNIVSVPEIVAELDTISLICVKREICEIKDKMNKNPSFVFPSITTLTNGAVSSGDLTQGRRGNEIKKNMLSLRRENCYLNIDFVTKKINSTIQNRKTLSEISWDELAELSAEFNLNRFLDKTKIVKLLYKARGIKLNVSPKNTTLYKKL